MKNVIMILGSFAILLSTSVAMAEALLDNSLNLNLGGNTVVFYPDKDDKYHFYYLPLKPRFATRKHPEFGEVKIFQFTKFGFNVEENKDDLKSGILDLSLTVSLPSDLLDNAKAQIAESRNLVKKRVKIGMIDIKTAHIEVKVVGSDKANKTGKLAHSYHVSNTSLSHAGAAANLTIELNPEGSALYEKMITGAAGLNVSYVYTYVGYPPDIEVKATGTWNSVYTHYSKSSQARTKAGFWFFGGSYDRSFEKVRDDLMNNTDINIEWIKSPESNDSVDKQTIKEEVEKSILEEILTAVLAKEPLSFNEKPVESAKASLNTGLFGAVGYAVNVKDIKKQRTGSIKIHYKSDQQKITPKNVNEDYLNVQPPNEDIRKMMFVDVTRDDFFNTARVRVDNANINPKTNQFGRVKTLKYVLTDGDVTIEKLFIPSDDGTKLVPLEKDDANLFNDVHFVNPRNKYDISYHAELNIENTFMKCGAIELQKQGLLNIGQSLEEIGFNRVKVDVSEVRFRQEADLYNKNPNTLPKYLIIKLKQGERRKSFKIKVDNKKDSIFWPVCNKMPLKIKILAKGYKEKPTKRKYEGEGEVEDLYLDNDDFK